MPAKPWIPHSVSKIETEAKLLSTEVQKLITNLLNEEDMSTMWSTAHFWHLLCSIRWGYVKNCSLCLWCQKTVKVSVKKGKKRHIHWRNEYYLCACKRWHRQELVEISSFQCVVFLELQWLCNHTPDNYDLIWGNYSGISPQSWEWNEHWWKHGIGALNQEFRVAAIAVNQVFTTVTVTTSLWF